MGFGALDSAQDEIPIFPRERSHVPVQVGSELYPGSRWIGFSLPCEAGNLGMSSASLLMLDFEERFGDFLLQSGFPIFQAFRSLWEWLSREPEQKEN